MWVLGHSVLGTALVRRWAVPAGGRLRWVVLGALAPDLLDKPLYYGLAWATGRRGAELGLISGTRTFGHTLALLLLVSLAALLTRAAALRAFAWGQASHLLLDNLGDVIAPRHVDGPTTLDGCLFPLRGWAFPVSPFPSVREHILSVSAGYVVFGEALGLALLVWWLWRRRRGAHA